MLQLHKNKHTDKYYCNLAIYIGQQNINTSYISSDYHHNDAHYVG